MFRLTLVLLLLVGMSLGCSEKSEIEKVVVSGHVTYNGTPMKKGRITLFPLEGTKGPVSGAEIRDGNYSIDSKGGVPVGKHRVEFHQFEVDPTRESRGLPPPMVENNVLPAEFNVKSPYVLEVKSGSAIEKNYDLKLSMTAAK